MNCSYRLPLPIVAAMLVVLLTGGCSRNQPVEPVVVENGIMGQLPPGQKVAAVYLRIANNTEADLVINYVHTPIASEVEVHRNSYQDGVMRMRQVNHVRVPAQEALLFEPGGYHFMLMGIEQDLELGETFDLTIEFEGGITVTTPITVKPLG